jgi:signal transduction histidine kinase
MPRPIKRLPATLLLACLAAATMLFISEGSYWLATEILERPGGSAQAQISDAVQAQTQSPTRTQLQTQLQTSAESAAGSEEMRHVLLASRIGVAALSLVSLLALSLYLRQGAALEARQETQKTAAQADHVRLELEVARRTAELTALTKHLLTAREDERTRLARDLHDELGALLTLAKLDAARIRARLGDSAPEAQDRLAHLVVTLNSGIALKRRIIEDLRPSALSHLGLVATLKILAHEFSKSSGVRVHCALEPVPLEADAELVVYRFVQEAITNIGKHAKAQGMWLSLAAQGGQAAVSVRDDGVGFDAEVRRDSAHGLAGMRFRVEAEGGRMELSSATGRGTSIRVLMPSSDAVAVMHT